jgi:hypothetical protein
VSDELRAALERLRRYDAEGLLAYGGPGDADKLHGTAAVEMYQAAINSRDADRAILADAYLAERPADDDLPVTEEWLRAVGFVWREDWMSWVSDGCDQCIQVSRSVEAPKEWTLQYERDFCWPHALIVRSDLRRLCAALGIALKDST